MASRSLQWLRQLLRLPHPFEYDALRWVVLDTEASGLDPRRDRLLSIAAVALDMSVPRRPPSLRLADSFEAVLRQGGPGSAGRKGEGREDILIHGIGLGAQAQGDDAQQALLSFERYVGTSPLLAFHSNFDQALLDRHMAQTLGRKLRNPWVDLEHVAAVLCKQPRRASLDEWLQRLGLRCDARHQASADALVTAQLLQKLWPLLLADGQASWAGVSRIAGEARFMTARA